MNRNGYDLPPQILESLDAYVNDRRPTGDFLKAVLCNDLKDACGRADETNQRRLVDIVGYVYNELPSVCWGSPENVEAWLNKKEPKNV